ncbi:hypothetical protein SCLCIDRAFT_1215220 [Scleroderma citrinum Foug A]|uniref:Uncharacterized protein n=1 Tax=Scleroderma citrinum Foug A TaxID=1036808 RepID=A0A0C3E1D9_9AGAM|nr:hypothetical protein SCLCIDRAFT_1215220 [Scleroderma citrinum Foug A]
MLRHRPTTGEDISPKTKPDNAGLLQRGQHASMLCSIAVGTTMLWKMSICAVYMPTVHGLNLPRVSAQILDLREAWEFESSQC